MISDQEKLKECIFSVQASYVLSLRSYFEQAMFWILSVLKVVRFHILLIFLHISAGNKYLTDITNVSTFLYGTSLIEVDNRFMVNNERKWC